MGYSPGGRKESDVTEHIGIKAHSFNKRAEHRLGTRFCVRFWRYPRVGHAVLALKESSLVMGGVRA